jgi:hypothetical protein
VIDCITGRAPPFDPGWATKELAETVKRYCHAVVGDAYSMEWTQSAWRSNNVSYTVSRLNKSAIYIETLPLFTQGLVSLPDHAKLLRELRLLERRAYRSGKDSVDHGRSGSDDYANAVCGVLYQLARRGYPSDLSWVSDEKNEAEDYVQRRLWAHIQAHGGLHRW